MRANAADTDVDTDMGTSIAPPKVLIDVQYSDALGAAEQDFQVPEAAEFERWAVHTLKCASSNGWDTAWRARTGAIEESELCIRLVDAVEGAALNAAWRDKQTATNVLSFTADIVAGHYAPLGDLVLCAPVVERESVEQEKSVAQHYAHLVVHGVLHLLGFDHLIDTEAEAMEAMEAAVLSELGIGNPYE